MITTDASRAVDASWAWGTVAAPASIERIHTTIRLQIRDQVWRASHVANAGQRRPGFHLVTSLRSQSF